MQKLARQPALHKPMYRRGNRLQKPNEKCFKPASGASMAMQAVKFRPNLHTHTQGIALPEDCPLLVVGACEQISGAKTDATICPKRKANARAASEHPRSDASATDLDIAPLCTLAHASRPHNYKRDPSPSLMTASSVGVPARRRRSVAWWWA